MAPRTNLKLRLVASYLGQTYVTLIGVLIAPVYVRYLGAEGYGLVGLFTLTQSWLALLDFGFSATLAREAARYGAGKGTAGAFRDLVTILNRVFVGSGVLIAVAGVAGSPWISRHWLKLGAVSPTEATIAIAIMAVTVALRWRTEPYRSILIGFERQVWLNGFNSVFATIRYVGAALLLAFFHASITVFFAYQLVVALVEATVILLAAHRLLPSRPPISTEPRLTWPTLKPLLRFSLGVAFVSTVWLFLSQYDKLLLSTLLPLKRYGVFALATVAAGGVSLLSSPVGQVVMPRLTALHASGNDAELRRVYRAASAFVTALVVPASLAFALFGGEIMWVWTGDRGLAGQAAPILRWYALGNGLLAITAFSYFLQYAHGDLKLHIRGNLAFALVLTPAITIAAVNYGAVGAGEVWFASNLFFLIGWTFLVHWRFAPGLHWRWLGRDVLLVALPGAAIIAGVRMVALPWYGSRMIDLATLAILGSAAVVAGGALVPGVAANVRAAMGMLRGRR